MEIAHQIKTLLAKGETEKALDLLLENADALDNTAQQQIFLLSGQYKQWKRERMLGIEQSSSELRRIELAIMELLDAPKAAASRKASAAPSSLLARYWPVLVGLLFVGVAGWFVVQSRTASAVPATASTLSAAESPASEPSDPTSPLPTSDLENPPTSPTPTSDLEKLPPPAPYVYATIELADKTWMAENLREPMTGSVCAHSDEAICRRSGRLYTWAMAKRACKALGEGWRLPTDADWLALTRMYGGAYGDAGDGQQAYQRLVKGGPTYFNGNYGGKQIYVGDPPSFYTYDYDKIGYYWVDKAENDKPAYAQVMVFRSNDQLLLYQSAPNTEYLSCRCVKD